MPYPNRIAITLILLLLVLGCDDPNDETMSETVSVQVDLLDGFAGHAVRIEFFDEEVFSETLSLSVPFAGPLASFTTKRPRGQNQINVHWLNSSSDESSSYWENFVFDLGDAEKYYIYINATTPGSLQVIVQDSSFLYL